MTITTTTTRPGRLSRILRSLAAAAAIAGSSLGAEDGWTNPDLAKYPTATVCATGLAVGDHWVTVGQLHSVTGLSLIHI